MKHSRIKDAYVRVDLNFPYDKTINDVSKDFVYRAINAAIDDCKRHLDYKIDFEIIYEDYCSECGSVWEECYCGE